jgi:hypothetical protein
LRHLLSLMDAAQQLRLQIATLRDWRQKRTHLEFVKVGGRVCVTQESIDEFVAVNTLRPLPSKAKAPGSKCHSRMESEAQAFGTSSSTREGERP